MNGKKRGNNPTDRKPKTTRARRAGDKLKAPKRSRPSYTITADRSTPEQAERLVGKGNVGRLFELCLSNSTRARAIVLASLPREALEEKIQHARRGEHVTTTLERFHAGIAAGVLRERENAASMPYPDIRATPSLIERTYERVREPIPPDEQIRAAVFNSIEALSDFRTGTHQLGEHSVLRIEHGEPAELWTVLRDLDKAIELAEQWYGMPFEVDDWQEGGTAEGHDDLFVASLTGEVQTCSVRLAQHTRLVAIHDQFNVDNDLLAGNVVEDDVDRAAETRPEFPRSPRGNHGTGPPERSQEAGDGGRTDGGSRRGQPRSPPRAGGTDRATARSSPRPAKKRAEGRGT